jgi:hypothetical protein
MDFLDYDTFSGSTYGGNDQPALPEPAGPLVLPPNNNTLTNKFKSLSLLHQNIDSNGSDLSNTNNVSKTAEKHASLTLLLLKNTADESVLISDLSQQSSSKISESTSNQVLSNKLSQVLNSYQSNDHSLRDALNILQSRHDLELDNLIRSDLYGSMSRRSFRSDFETELLKQHSNILRNFEPIVSKIESLDYKINELNETSAKLNSIKGINSNFLEKVEELLKQKKLITLQKTILLNFKKKFTLTQYEEHYLTNEPVSIQYFEILNKAKRIHSSCSILLSINSQSLGFKIMEKMNSILELSYQRITFFLSNELHNLMKNSQLEVNNYQTTNLKLIKISLFYLSSQLQNFNDVISKLIQSRSKIINDEFAFQLNNGSNSFDHSRPIALSAHDPVRYIGDILAYVHSIIVNEIEFISNLFQFDPDAFNTDTSDFERNLQALEDPVNLQNSMSSVISKVIASLKVPLKLRIEQVLRAETNLEVIHQVFSLLDLYKMMYKKQLSTDDSGILQTLEFLQNLSTERIFNIIEETFKKVSKENLASDWSLDDESLLAPDWLNVSLSEALSIFRTDEYSDTNIFNFNDQEFKSLTELIVLKPIEMIDFQADKLFKKDLNSKFVFKLNSLDLIESKVLSVSKLANQSEKVSALISEAKQKLINAEYETLLAKTGLNIHQQLIQLIFPIEQIETEDDYYMYSSLIENKLFNLEHLKSIELKLHDYLPIAIIEIQQSLFKITSPSIVNDVINQVSLNFLNLYNVFYKVLKLLYEDQDLLEWSVFEVATLLGVENLYDEIKV